MAFLLATDSSAHKFAFVAARHRSDLPGREMTINDSGNPSTQPFASRSWFRLSPGISSVTKSAEPAAHLTATQVSRVAMMADVDPRPLAASTPGLVGRGVCSTHPSSTGKQTGSLLHCLRSSDYRVIRPSGLPRDGRFPARHLLPGPGERGSFSFNRSSGNDQYPLPRNIPPAGDLEQVETHGVRWTAGKPGLWLWLISRAS